MPHLSILFADLLNRGTQLKVDITPLPHFVSIFSYFNKIITSFISVTIKKTNMCRSPIGKRNSNHELEIKNDRWKIIWQIVLSKYWDSVDVWDLKQIINERVNVGDQTVCFNQSVNLETIITSDILVHWVILKSFEMVRAWSVGLILYITSWSYPRFARVPQPDSLRLQPNGRFAPFGACFSCVVFT